MTFQQEIASWMFPSQLPSSPIPSIGANVPSTSQLHLPEPDGNPTLLTFLRHCGCPFAEKTFLSFRATASLHPSIHFIAISHSDQSATDKWLEAIGGAGNVRVIVDKDRELFAQWGLGMCSFWHVLSPAGLWNVYKLGRDQGIVSKFSGPFVPPFKPQLDSRDMSRKLQVLTGLH